MSKNKSGKYRGIRRGTLVTGTIGTLVAVAAGVTPAVAAAGTLALTSVSGPTGGGNTLIATFATAPTSPNTTTFNAATGVNFVAPSGSTAATCPTTYTTPGTGLGSSGTNLRVLTPTKLAVTVPTGVTHSGTAASTKYKLCVYNSATVATTSTLVASADYTVGAKPTLAAVDYISPTSGPALGGTTVTVTGTNFVANTTAAPNNTTATLGGLPLTNIVVSGGTSFTATTPAHVAEEDTLLVVTTPGGSVSTLGSPATATKADVFDFTNGIVVTPNTAPNTKTTPTDLSVTGVGFSAMDFSVSATGVDPNNAGAHIFLSRGRYTDNINSGNKVNGPVAECIDVIVVTDTELLCSMPLFQTRGADGDFTFSRTTPVATTEDSLVIRSVMGTFTENDEGAAITVPSNTQIPASTTIDEVQSPYLATLTAAADATATTVTATIALEADAALSSASITTGTSTLTGTFAAADVGKAVTGNAAIPDNTYIESVTSGTTAVLSNNATSTLSSATGVILKKGIPVASDAYVVHVVSNGAAGASISDDSYSQSIVSSAATFTVSDY